MKNIKRVMLTRYSANVFLYSIILLCLASCDLRYGFIEAEFRLASESRLPKWLTLPPGYSRRDISIGFIFYTHPFKNYVKCIVYGPDPERKKLNEQVGTQRYHPDTEKKNRSDYPRYIIIKIDGIEEVFEHRQRGDILCVTDDSKITSVLKGN